MLIKATRTISALTLRALAYGVLFLVVVVVHVALTGALRQLGWSGGSSLFVSGAVVLAIVLIAVNLADFVRERRASAREIERMRQGLPSGPCCVIWRGAETEGDMPWEIAAPMRAHYPKLARRFGVEGLAVVEFEISAQGTAKNIHCVDAWPSEVFYGAARQALSRAQFRPKPGAQVRFGASYRIPFVFRIAGATHLVERGHRAKAHRPAVDAARQAVEKLRRQAEADR